MLALIAEFLADAALFAWLNDKSEHGLSWKKILFWGLLLVAMAAGAAAILYVF